MPAPPADADTLREIEKAGFRYERCENRARYRLVRAGKRALTSDEMSAVGRGLLPPTSGPASVGIGSCECATTEKAPGHVRPLCVSISLRAADLDPPALAGLVSRRIEELALADATVGIRVDLHAKPGPRCLPDDPPCGPIPVGQRCPSDVGYVAGRTRQTIFEQIDGGPCSHDGECDSGTCDSCFSTRESDRFIAGDCFAINGMKPNALCGCVAGQCRFFVQTP
jgi:hypothetical protein